MKTKIFITILYAVALLTLMIPYQQRIQLGIAIENTSGYEMMFLILSLTSLMISTIMIYLDLPHIWPLSVSVFNMFVVWLIRFEIHFQDFDHHYDTQSGAGYYILVICSILYTSIMAFNLISSNKARKSF